MSEQREITTPQRPPVIERGSEHHTLRHTTSRAKEEQIWPSNGTKSPSMRLVGTLWASTGENALGPHPYISERGRATRSYGPPPDLRAPRDDSPHPFQPVWPGAQPSSYYDMATIPDQANTRAHIIRFIGFLFGQPKFVFVSYSCVLQYLGWAPPAFILQRAAPASWRNPEHCAATALAHLITCQTKTNTRSFSRPATFRFSSACYYLASSTRVGP